MTWKIYAIRLRGDSEARYIGQTSKTAQCRLDEFNRFAKSGCGQRLMGHWLLANTGNVECIVIDTARTEADARAKERAAVTLFSGMGHRLFNRQLIAPNLRLAVLETVEPWTPKDAAA